MLNITSILDEIKSRPYTDLKILAPHTGFLEFTDINEGDQVKPARGQWKEKPGTKIAIITRENNPKNISSPQKGIIQKIYRQYDKAFVEAGSEIATVRHYLSKQEVIKIILQKTLFLFNAPERAKYFFAPEVDKKLKISGHKSISVTAGMDLFIISRMKREISLAYDGPDGLIYELYFEQNKNVGADQPLIGVCPPEQLSTIEEVVSRVNHEWEEPE